MTIYNRPDDLPVWAESGDKIQPTNPQIQEGWPLSTIPPTRQRFNWILNFVSNAMRYFLQRGIPEWSTDEDYPLAGRVQHAGVTWVAILANTGIEPGTDPAIWERWGYSESELIGILDPITPDPTNNRVGINSALPEVSLDIIATDAIRLPSGTTAQRPVGADGYLRHNSTLNIIEGWLSGAWTQIGGVIADASTTVKGIVELATSAETITGTDADRAVTPAGLQAKVASVTALGIVELATSAETQTGTDTARAITPAAFRAASLAQGQTWQNLTASRALATTYTNSTNKPIQVHITTYSITGGSDGTLTVGGVVVSKSTQPSVGYNVIHAAVIPAGATYTVAQAGTGATLYHWAELR